MILVGSERGGATALANHLMNARDNDHVSVLEVDGFLGSTLHDTFGEADAVSKGTRCDNFLFSLSLNPPENAVVTDEGFRETANRAGRALGLVGQPRVVVIHEKEVDVAP